LKHSAEEDHQIGLISLLGCGRLAYNILEYFYEAIVSHINAPVDDQITDFDSYIFNVVIPFVQYFYTKNFSQSRTKEEKPTEKQSMSNREKADPLDNSKGKDKEDPTKRQTKNKRFENPKQSKE